MLSIPKKGSLNKMSQKMRTSIFDYITPWSLHLVTMIWEWESLPSWWIVPWLLLPWRRTSTWQRGWYYDDLLDGHTQQVWLMRCHLFLQTCWSYLQPWSSRMDSLNGRVCWWWCSQGHRLCCCRRQSLLSMSWMFLPDLHNLNHYTLQWQLQHQPLLIFQ